VVHNYLKLRNNYGLKGKRGRKKILSQTVRRAIIRAASGKIITAKKIKDDLGLVVSVRTIRKELSSCPTLIRKKLKQKPKLTQKHKDARVEMCTKWLRERLDWDTVVFSDEKKFNLDGPDSFEYYWHNLNGEEKYLSKRKFGGGSLMVWGAIGSNGKSDLIVINGRMCSGDYCEMLKNHLLPSEKKVGGKNWIFQQDNAAIHTSKESMEWFKTKKINVLNWPSIIPDLNPIENVWGLLVRKLFSDGKQFNSVRDLVENLIAEWDSLSVDYLKTLTNSMSKRCIEVIKSKGATIKY
jgi:transposase